MSYVKAAAVYLAAGALFALGSEAMQRWLKHDPIVRFKR